MKHSKLYTHLGMTGALLIPALAVAAVNIPNVFQGGDRVSASEMNENFEEMAEAIEALEAKTEAIEALEAKVEALESTGLEMPRELANYSAPEGEPFKLIYQVHTDGIVASRTENAPGFDSTSIRLDVGITEESLDDCPSGVEICAAALGRGHAGSSSSVFVPAGHFVAIEIDQLVEDAMARIYWQPLRGPDPVDRRPQFVKRIPPTTP